MLRLFFVGALFLFSGTASALDCVPQEMSQERFEQLDLIVKGQVEIIEKATLFQNDDVEFLVHVDKAWKGAKAGETVNVHYKVLGGDGFGYRTDMPQIVYAVKKEDELVTDGCMIFDYPMPEEMRRIQLPSSDPKVRENRKKAVDKFFEDTLDSYMK